MTHSHQPRYLPGLQSNNTLLYPTLYEHISLKQNLRIWFSGRGEVISLCKKWKLMLRLNVQQKGSTHNLSLSQQEGTFSPGDSR
jgi:hypothetical protein